jgi:hypothetical protein
MFCLCGSTEYVFGVAPEPRFVAQHNTCVSHYSLTGQRRHLLHGSTTTCMFVSRGLLLMVNIDSRHELAHPAVVHIYHAPDCMNLVPWHSTLYN